MSTIFLKSDELVIGSKGSVFFTISKRRTEMAGVQRISAERRITTQTFATIGTVNKQTRITGLEGSGSMTVNYWMIKIFRAMISEFEEQGVFPEWDIMVVNEQGGATLGNSTIQLFGCQPTGSVPIALLDATTDDGLTIDIDFTFRSSENLEEFSDPQRVGREG